MASSRSSLLKLDSETMPEGHLESDITENMITVTAFLHTSTTEKSLNQSVNSLVACFENNKLSTPLKIMERKYTKLKQQKWPLVTDEPCKNTNMSCHDLPEKISHFNNSPSASAPFMLRKEKRTLKNFGLRQNDPNALLFQPVKNERLQKLNFSEEKQPLKFTSESVMTGLLGQDFAKPELVLDLEDVDGVLFVSFATKEILDDNTIGEREELQNVQASLLTTCDSDCQISLQLLERKLLEDLKSFRHKQVIHPSLQEVGLKLGSVDPTLSIDLKYLGVQLPLRSSKDYVFENNQGTNPSCQDTRLFISRTGKTNDFRKIKGWQGRFHSASRQEGSILTNSFKNRSAFCSDKLDEYLESERKLMETDVEFSSSSFSYPVAYQFPSKSTNCVQVLNSVLKKKSVSPPSAHTFNPLSLPSTFRKRKIKTKSKQGTKGRVKSSDKFAVPSYVLSKQKHNYSFKLLEQKQSNDIIGLSKTQLQLMELEDCALRDGKPRTYVTEERASSALDTLLISQVQVELMELEDSALQNGKPQNYITKERADLSLAALLIPQPPLKSKPIYDLIGSQELQYNNTFCNVEDVCADLAFEKCQPTCPSKTVGTSDCLKRRMSVLTGASMPKQHLKRSLCEILTKCKDQEEKEMAWVNSHSRCNVKSIYSAETDQPIEDFPITLKEEREIDAKTVYLPSLSAAKPMQHMMQPYSEVVLPFKSSYSGIKRDQLRIPKFNPVVKQIQQEHKYAVPSHFEKMWSYACTSKYKDSIGKKKQQHRIKQTLSSEKCIGEDHTSDVPEEPCGIESYSGESDVGIPSARTYMFPEKSASHSSSAFVCPARKLASETLQSKLISRISETQATTILPSEPVSELQAVDLCLKLYPASIVHSTTNSVPLQSGRFALPHRPGQEAVSHTNFHNILSLQVASNSFSISVQEELDTMRPEEEIVLHSEEVIVTKAGVIVSDTMLEANELRANQPDSFEELKGKALLCDKNSVMTKTILKNTFAEEELSSETPLLYPDVFPGILSDHSYVSRTESEKTRMIGKKQHDRHLEGVSDAENCWQTDLSGNILWESSTNQPEATQFKSTNRKGINIAQMQSPTTSLEAPEQIQLILIAEELQENQQTVSMNSTKQQEGTGQSQSQWENQNDFELQGKCRKGRCDSIEMESCKEKETKENDVTCVKNQNYGLGKKYRDSAQAPVPNSNTDVQVNCNTSSHKKGITGIQGNMQTVKDDLVQAIIAWSKASWKSAAKCIQQNPPKTKNGCISIDGIIDVTENCGKNDHPKEEKTDGISVYQTETLQSELRRSKPKNVAPTLASYRLTHTANEQRRRREIKELFDKLKVVLGLHTFPRVAKRILLKQAVEEIQRLIDQAAELTSQKQLLLHEKGTLIHKVSVLSGKPQEVILKKLDYILSKQKTNIQKNQEEQVESMKTAKTTGITRLPVEQSPFSFSREMKQIMSNRHSEPSVLFRKSGATENKEPMMPRIVNVRSLTAEGERHLSLDVRKNYVMEDADLQTDYSFSQMQLQEMANLQPGKEAGAGERHLVGTMKPFPGEKENFFPQMVSSFKGFPGSSMTKFCTKELAGSQAKLEEMDKEGDRQKSKDSLFQKVQDNESKGSGLEMEQQNEACMMHDTVVSANALMEIEENDEILTSLLNETAFLNKNDNISDISKFPKSLSSGFSLEDMESCRASTTEGSPFHFGTLSGCFKDFSIVQGSSDSVIPLLLHLESDNPDNLGEPSSPSDVLTFRPDSEVKDQNPNLSTITSCRNLKNIKCRTKAAYTSLPSLQMKPHHSDIVWKPMPKLALFGLKDANFVLDSEQNTKLRPSLAQK